MDKTAASKSVGAPASSDDADATKTERRVGSMMTSPGRKLTIREVARLALDLREADSVVCRVVRRARREVRVVPCVLPPRCNRTVNFHRQSPTRNEGETKQCLWRVSHWVWQVKS